jgi:chloramphenicol-sensitive protein RarD
MQPPDYSAAAWSRTRARQGLLGALGAFAIWGAMPLYLHELHGISALTIMAHRLVWCCLLVCAWLAVRGQIGGVCAALVHRSTRVRLVAGAALISTNWLIYIWAVGGGHVVDASLGYFINPLVNVLLGVLLLGERLRRPQWVAVGCAAAGVAWLAVRTNGVPWIALALALTFGGYGLIRKVAAVDSVTGLAAETALAALLVAGGVITAVPLSLFAFGARRIPYSTVGLVQYVSPSLQLSLGVLLFGEEFPPGRAVGFGLIWTALVVYAADGLRRARPFR